MILNSDIICKTSCENNNYKKNANNNYVDKSYYYQSVNIIDKQRYYYCIYHCINILMRGGSIV